MENKIDSQTNKWISSSSAIDTSELEKFIRTFQSSDTVKTFYHYLYDIIDIYYAKGKKIIEVGGQFGGNLSILNSGFEKTLLDLDYVAIEKAKELFLKLERKADFIVGDMFSMPIEAESFDIVFNSGVLEHFTQEERILALKEYSRILKKGGVMVIAIPNHLSVLYRFYYLFLNVVGLWKIPKEFKIKNFNKEISENELELIDTKVVASEVIFDNYNHLFGIGTLLSALHKIVGKNLNQKQVMNLNKKYGVGNILRCIHKYYKIDGYLITFIIRKP